MERISFESSFFALIFSIIALLIYFRSRLNENKKEIFDLVTIGTILIFAILAQCFAEKL